MVTTGQRITVEGLRKEFHSKQGTSIVLDNISLDVAEGEFVVILGPSGCGKTTLLRCIAGLERPDAGEIKISGTTVHSSVDGTWYPPEKRHLAMVFQSYALWPHLTVFDNVAYPLRNQQIPSADIEERVRTSLAQVGLSDFEATYPGRLSGGEQQRVALARAVVADEGVILFDEPLSNIDAQVRERVRLELVEMQARLGFSALYVTHDQNEASAIANRIVVMSKAQIAQIGPPRIIYERPRSQYVANFMGSANELLGTVDGRAGDSMWKVKTSLGHFVATADKDLQLRDEQPVVLIFRPEHCRLEETFAEGENGWQCTIERSLFLGSYTEYVVSSQGHRFLARSMSPELIADGSQRSIVISPRYMWILKDVS